MGQSREAQEYSRNIATWALMSLLDSYDILGDLYFGVPFQSLRMWLFL